MLTDKIQLILNLLLSYYNYYPKGFILLESDLQLL
jgi:hypothetical protein